MVSITFLYFNGTVSLPLLQILPFAAKYIRRHNFLSMPFSLSGLPEHKHYLYQFFCSLVPLPFKNVILLEHLCIK